MKKMSLLIITALFAHYSFGQGIDFSEGNWKDIVTLAKKEHKLIFMDVYTTWCGPCKMMDKNIFPQKPAGDLHNANFINYKLDAEKGEGPKIAATYGVNAYPTNLFINPENESLVYKAIGYADLDNFLERGNDALKEYKDPIKWDEYVARYKSGKYDKNFLISYMTKAKRKDKNYDDALNSFIDKYTKKTISDADLKTLVMYTETFDNKASDIIYTNKERAFPPNTSIDGYWEMISYNTLSKAVDLKSEKLLSLIEEKSKQYNLPSTITDKYKLHKEYYQRLKDKQRYNTICEEEVNYFMTLNNEAIAIADSKAAEQSKVQLLAQLKAQNVPEDQLQTSVDATMAKYPQYSKPASTEIANALNTLSWNVVESKTTDKAKLNKALIWSKRSLDMSEGTDMWPLFADTYAHLLFMQGNKTAAIALEEKAITEMTKTNPDQAKDMQQGLEEMKKQ